MNATELPRVSVITASYNRLATLPECLASVLGQSYPRQRLETIVIDGGSTDGTPAWLQEQAQAGRIDRWICEPDHGPYDAMNKGIALARGDFLVFLNTDDAFEPDAIARTVAALQESQADYAYADAILVDHASNRAIGTIPGNLANIYFHTPYCHQTLFCRRRCFEELGGFDLSLKILADYDFMWRLFAGGFQAVRLDAPTVRYRTGGLATAFAGAEALEVQRRQAAIYRDAFDRQPGLRRHYLWKALTKLAMAQALPEAQRQSYATAFRETLAALGLDTPGFRRHFPWPRRQLYASLTSRYTAAAPPPRWILAAAARLLYYEWRLRAWFAPPAGHNNAP